MRPPSKHGLERKYKPWRRGKSSSSSTAENNNNNNNSKRPTNASLKNRLRGQKRLLAKLRDQPQQQNETIAGVEESIRQLERDIGIYETREKEKKNAAKYHQVKFIERQKLTRLEKSIKRQLHQLQQLQQQNEETTTTTTTTNNTQKIKITELQKQLQSIAMDQLYIAFYPTNIKYMALFQTNNPSGKKYERIVDDERGAQRRKHVWRTIREGLLKELQHQHPQDDDDGEEGEEKQEQQKQTTTTTLEKKKWAIWKKYMALFQTNGKKYERIVDDERGAQRRKHVWRTIREGLLKELRQQQQPPQDDNDDDDDDEGEKEMQQEQQQKQTATTTTLEKKKWVNLEEAKKALLSMPMDTYPNSSSNSSGQYAASTIGGG
eukprot:CAMPEP_0183743876 /NCGR_PEP_ID=MMETSP0737-20130205/65441_1 /TAXON_ID=385413 /ORGANISM="Thalassiosira miniscula, Strain CCMP1093" /LENGTH=376 /DNA_ID=CAMNT_0025979505 /DNA_START=98 /DNA_END=1225 /DNA_ORIENTATION=-